jgi:phage-related baseplate assembly protein
MRAPITPPSFIDRDPERVERDMVALFEQITGRPLHPAQPERLFISVMAYLESQLRMQIQHVGEQSLVAFAQGVMLDFHGEIVGTPRLPATAAVTTLRFTLSAVQALPITIPASTRVQTTDGRVTFTTDEALTIAAGAASATVGATATVEGVIGNGYAAGAVSQILDPVAFVASAANTAITDRGAEIEDDERYRERIRQAPERFSVAGSREAYEFHAKSVSSAIADVAVTNPLMGVVRLHVLASTGLPSAALLAQVSAAVSADRVRPLSDTVEVIAPVEVAYQITATVRPLQGSDAAAVMEAARQAAEAYAADRRARLGQDVVPSQIVAALSVPGAYEVILTAPAYREVEPSEWANCTLITLTQGAANG